jgi:glycosyltransferase involved in cell wall biosynthesis
MSPANDGFRISVGIAAYNAEANIGELLRAVTSQCQDACCIGEIVVHSDESSDRTVAIAQENTDPRILIIDNPHRRGFAASVRTMLGAFKGDAIVLLNDDIRIRDRRFVEKCVYPIFHQGADLAGANLKPLPPRSFVERGFVSMFRVYKRMRERLADRNNLFTCDGAAFAASRSFARTIDFPADPGQMGNVDAFLFLSCVGAGHRYVYARNAVAWFRSPATLRDYVRRNVRNDSQEWILAERFGPETRFFFRAPRHLLWRSILAEVVGHPLAAAFVFVIGFYIRVKKHFSSASSPTWEVLRSSKDLH